MNKSFICMSLCIFSSTHAMEEKKQFPDLYIIKMYLDDKGYTHFAEVTEIHLKLNGQTLSYADFIKEYAKAVEKYRSLYFSDDPESLLLKAVSESIGKVLIDSANHYSRAQTCLQNYMKSKQAENGENKPST